MEKKDPAAASPLLSARRGIRFRALLLGLLATAAVHIILNTGNTSGYYATNMANGAYPVGPFNIFLVILAANLLFARIRPGRQLTAGELIIIYTMMAVGSLIGGEGQLAFILTTIAAPFYFASPENRWAEFFPHLKTWQFPHPYQAVRGFYEGRATVPWGVWIGPGLFWGGALLLLAVGTLCIAMLLRRQWMEHERLVFPTTALPLAMITSPGAFFSNRLMWLGFAAPFFLGTLNTLSLNYPSVPGIDVRGQFLDINKYMINQPWKSMGWTPLTLYPWVVGIGYLISSDVSLSLWVFYWVKKLEAVAGAALGIAPEGAKIGFPWHHFRGTGAFFWIFLVMIWAARRHLSSLVSRSKTSDPAEVRTGRWALAGWFVCFVLLTAFLIVAGLRPSIAALLLLLLFAYYTVTARIIAEAGAPWLFGPSDLGSEVIRKLAGDAFFRPSELAALQVTRSFMSNDVRTLPMPHQFVGLKMANSVRLRERPLVCGIILALVLGVVLSFTLGVSKYYRVGGLTGNSWAVQVGQFPFNDLRSSLQSPVPADPGVAVGLGVGFAIAGALTFLRSRLIGFPLHPLGFAIADTGTLSNCWFPFFLAWAVKSVVLRYGGSRLYRRSLPICLGVILGDLVQGGLWTFMAYCKAGFNAVPINW